eukprot:TRINITY_DN32639_c0_g1_i1.p1 TRINITY_DN32639_c0_g1~~TRINITY_DN32639_c0_g1_i1.p1  ORF type:complete len:154 (-),score=8.32 TRINITY_DN32639_c0_g1_i1:314-775(-)
MLRNKVTGGPHPIPSLQQGIVQVVTAAQLSTAALILVGDRYIFPALGMAPPRWYTDLTQNRLVALLGVFLAGNVINNNLAQTGAFEIYYDGRLMFSKLQSGQLPQLDRIMRLLEQAVEGTKGQAGSYVCFHLKGCDRFAEVNRIDTKLLAILD